MPTSITVGIATLVAIDGTLPTSIMMPGFSPVDIWQGSSLLGTTAAGFSGTFSITDSNGQTWTVTLTVNAMSLLVTSFTVTAPAFYAGQTGFTVRSNVGTVNPRSGSFSVVGVPSSSSSLSHSSSSSSSSSSVSPSSSSSSSSPTCTDLIMSPIARACRRLTHPDSSTVEQAIDCNLYIQINVPYEVILQVAPLIPNNGPDQLVISYADYQGQKMLMVRFPRMWMSDNGYVFLSGDQSTQILIASTNAVFWQENALTVNARNVSDGATPLSPCHNPVRYDTPKLIPNQVIPQLWIRDGSSIVSGQT